MTHIPTPCPNPRPVKRSSPPRFSTVNAVLFKLTAPTACAELVARDHVGPHAGQLQARHAARRVRPSTRTSSRRSPSNPTRTSARCTSREGEIGRPRRIVLAHVVAARHEIRVVGAGPDVGGTLRASAARRRVEHLGNIAAIRAALARSWPSPRAVRSGWTGAAPGSACCRTGRIHRARCRLLVLQRVGPDGNRERLLCGVGGPRVALARQHARDAHL